MTTPHPWSPPMTSTAIRINGKSAADVRPGRAPRQLCSCRHCDHLAALVEAAGGADPVRDVGGCALWAGAELGKFHHAVVGPAHTLAARRGFSFGNAHKLLNCYWLSSFSLSSAAQGDAPASGGPTLRTVSGLGAASP